MVNTNFHLSSCPRVTCQPIKHCHDYFRPASRRCLSRLGGESCINLRPPEALHSSVKQMNIREIARRYGLRGGQRATVTAARWALRGLQRPVSHGLSNELIVSLTSYAARFGTLGLTLRCLLTQSVKPDRVILWLAPEDIVRLPMPIRALTRHGLDIRETRDLRSYTKIIPALRAFPDAIIVTADDDLFYERHWLLALVRAWGRLEKSDRLSSCAPGLDQRWGNCTLRTVAA